MNAYNWFCLLTTLCSSRLSVGSPKPNQIVFPAEPQPRHLEVVEKSHFEIPLDMARKINNITLDELLENFVENPEPEILSARIGGFSVARKGARNKAKLAACIPEPTTVPLKPTTADVATYYHPPCTRVTRCGGCCGHDLLSCQPTEVETLQLEVVKMEYLGGSQLTFRGRDIISVEQHTACTCQCRIKEADCNRNQRYDENNCRCVCSNYDKQEKCKAEATKLWNPNECACVCRETLDCSSGYYFDRYNCKCVPERRKVSDDFDRLKYEVN